MTMTSNVLRLPMLPLGNHEAVLQRWLVAPGDQLVVGQPIAIMLGPTVEVAIPAEVAGTVRTLLVEAGGVLGVAEPLVALQAPVALPRLQRMSPVAQRMIAVHQLDPAQLNGSGTNGRILKRDVQALLEPPAPSPTQSIPSTESALLPLVVTMMEANFTSLRGDCQHDTLTLHARVAAVIVRVLPRFPMLNARWQADGLLLRRSVELLLGKRVVHNAQDLNARGIIRAFGAAACNGSPSFAIQFGEADRTHATSALCTTLHIGALSNRLAVVTMRGQDEIVTQPIAALSLQYDARVVDQREADTFLYEIKQGIEQWSGL